ncbi:MAG: hypothetical protein WBA74_07805 [Cyclobacteriaceae bacterium]
MEEVKPSILVSLFKRKGGEGQYTKIVSENNLPESLVLSGFDSDEIGLIICYKNDSDWFLLSNKRIRSRHEGDTADLNIQDLKEVTLAMQEEFKDGIRNKNDFSRLRITDKNGSSNLLYLEKGQPYEGLYQVLHFLASKN